MARRKKPRSAYLKHHPRHYDANSDYALRSRGGRAIDLGSVVPPTITHGKRGLTRARAVGPTAVINSAYTDDVDQQFRRGATKSTMIPKMAVEVHAEELVRLDQGPFFQRMTRFFRRSISPTLTVWFSGDEWVFVKRFIAEGVERSSIKYQSARAHDIINNGWFKQIHWDDERRIPPDPSG